MYLKKWEIVSYCLENWISILTLIFTIWIWFSANRIASNQNNISDQQTEILSQQTQILKDQTTIQSSALQFEKDRWFAETNQKYNEDLNYLYNKILDPNDDFFAIHKKIKSWEDVIVEENLTRYVDAFENIGKLYCDGKIRLTDLKFTLGELFKYPCGNRQIFYKFQNSKSWLSAVCEKLYPWSTVMATFADTGKCPILLDR